MAHLHPPVPQRSEKRVNRPRVPQPPEGFSRGAPDCRPPVPQGREQRFNGPRIPELAEGIRRARCGRTRSRYLRWRQALGQPLNDRATKRGIARVSERRCHLLSQGLSKQRLIEDLSEEPLGDLGMQVRAEVWRVGGRLECNKELLPELV